MQIGVCSWCIDRQDPSRAIEAARWELELAAVQVGFFSSDVAERCDPAALAEHARAHDVALVGTFAAFEREDYSSVSAIKATGGLLPDATYPERLAMLRQVCALSRKLNCGNVGIHLGTVPEDAASAVHARLRDRLIDAADLCAEFGQRLSLETGREPVAALIRLIEAADRDNVGVSFDPANLFVYASDEPVNAVPKLRGLIDFVHIKDAVRPQSPGLSLGRQVAIGTGDVDVPRVVSKLRASGYAGPLLIETNLGGSNLQTLRAAAAYLRSMLA